MPFDTADLDELMHRVEATAAAEIMPRFQRLGLRVQQKTSAFDVVTEADEAAEQAITAALHARHRGCVVVGEEAAARDASLLAGIDTAELAFVVDPLDGTKNFASGLPLFGVMVAVLRRGEVVAAVIHDPVCRSTAFALRGGGAWNASADGTRQRLHVAPAVPLAQMEGIAGTNFLPAPLRATVNANLGRLGVTNWFRCAAHEYRLAAAGQLHLLFYNRLMPWDHAAGWLLHREAGGFSAHFDGSAYRPAHTTGGLLCAPDEAAWHAVRDALLGAAPTST